MRHRYYYPFRRRTYNQERFSEALPLCQAQLTPEITFADKCTSSADIRIVKELKLLEIDGVLASIHVIRKSFTKLHTCSHGFFYRDLHRHKQFALSWDFTQTNTVITKLNQGDLLNIAIFLAKNFPDSKRFSFAFLISAAILC